MPKNFFLALALLFVTQVEAAEPVDFYDRFLPPIVTFMARSNFMLQGELEGKGTVVIELKFSRKNAGEYSGRYFSTHDGFDIPLEEVTNKGELLVLAEPEPVRDEKGKIRRGALETSRYIWNMTRDVNREGDEWYDEWTGLRTDQRTGETRAIRLRRVQWQNIAPFPGFGKDEKNLPELYAYLQIHAIAKPAGAETGNEKLAYQMWEDPRTGFQYPRLTRHPNPEVMQRVNFLLEERHARFAAEALWAQDGRCHDANTPSWANSGGATVIYLTSTLMNMVERGGLFPCMSEFFVYQHPVTFDLTQGTYLDWNRLFDFFVSGEDENGPRPSPSPAARKLVEHLQKERGTPEGCPLSEEKFWEVYFNNSSELNLVLEPPYRMATPCVPAIITLPLLKSMLKPEGLRYLDDMENVAVPPKFGSD
jgi:hypothetical protein